MSKLIAIHGGGDWADASVRFMEVPDDLDEDEAKRKWRMFRKEHPQPYVSLEDFIKREFGGDETDKIECWWGD